MEQAGFDVEARSIDALAKSIPVLVVTGDSSGSALVAERSATNKLPNPAAGVPTGAYAVCDNDLVIYSKDFDPKATVTKQVCSAEL